MIKKIFIACLLSLTAAICSAGERIELYVGEIKVLKVNNIDRIAVGNPAILSNSMLNNGQLLLIAEGEGSSEVHIWFSDGSESDFMVHVTSQANNLVNRKNEVEKLLADIEGLEVNVVGEKIVLSGVIADGHEAAIQTVMDNFEDVMNNINFPINNLEKIKMEVEDLLSDIDGLNVRIVGGHVVLSGEIESGYDTAIETVQGVMPEVMNLTKTGGLDLSSPDNKMVLMNIKITEFNKNYLQNLGIAWDTTVAGPAAGLAFDVENNSVFRATESPTTTFNGALTATNTSSTLGYFGIVSEITSRINFAVNSGNALILAEPRLAARSGGEATFLAGGEFPIQTSNINGTTVEFKEFGIQLEVKPVVDTNNNVLASVTTELSSIDQSVAVAGVPGLLSRKTSADVVLGSGETLVMSGLLNQEASEDITGLKFLMDIPILGELFKSTTFRDKKSELVIFVTPQVFDANSDLNQKALDYAKQGIKGVIDAIDRDSLDIIY
jgi:pilus assembly protein CpaC